MDYLSESTRLLYTQLLSQCLHGAAPSGRGLSFVKKNIKNSTHWYLQVTTGSQKKQHYLGPESDAMQALIQQEKARWKEAGPDRKTREKLVAMLIAGDAHTLSATEARVLELLERAGAFIAGGTLVDSHAFAVYGNMLGVKWPTEATCTQDIDIAADHSISIGISDQPIDLKQALLDVDMGFVEVPALNRKSPSTSFRIQGKQLSVDLLTPMLGKPSSSPVFITSLNTYAEPLRFLDYLLEDTQPAVIAARAGMLINVPAPARYALHKLVTAARRPSAMQGKNLKDLDQAKQLFNVLMEDRPGDLLLAREAAEQQPGKFMQQLKQGLKRLPAASRDALKEYVGA